MSVITGEAGSETGAAVSDNEENENKIWSWRVKVLVKFLFVLTLIICIGVVLDEDNVLEEDREHKAFTNFCFVFTLLLLLPTAYESGTSVFFWYDPDRIDMEHNNGSVETYYANYFQGWPGFICAIIVWLFALIVSPFFVLFLMFQWCRECYMCCWNYDVSDAEDKVEDAFDTRFGILVGMLDAWQFLLLIPLAFIIISGADSKADALINTVAIQFLASLEDQFIGSFGAEERFEKFKQMVEQYKQPEKTPTLKRMPSQADPCE